MWTNSGNWTSIFGSYSPITPEREMQMSTSVVTSHAWKKKDSKPFSCKALFLWWVGMFCNIQHWAEGTWSSLSTVTEYSPKEKNEEKRHFAVDMQSTDVGCETKNNSENSYKGCASTSRWVSSCCSANSYEPENRPIKSPWVLLLFLQSIPFTVCEAALLDYNIAAVHAKKFWIKEQRGMWNLRCSSCRRQFFINQECVSSLESTYAFFSLSDSKVNYFNEFVIGFAFISHSGSNSGCTTQYFKPLSFTAATIALPHCCNSELCCTNSSGDGGNRPLSFRWFGEACVIRMAPWVTVKANSDPYHNCLLLKCNHITISHFKQAGWSG